MASNLKRLYVLNYSSQSVQTYFYKPNQVSWVRECSSSMPRAVLNAQWLMKISSALYQGVSHGGWLLRSKCLDYQIQPHFTCMNFEVEKFTNIKVINHDEKIYHWLH